MLSGGADAKVQKRANTLFLEHKTRIAERTDQLFAVLMALQWSAGVMVAHLISPRTWSGAQSQVHLHVWAALLLGGALAGLPIALVMSRPGRTLNRFIIAFAQMLTSSLLIHLTGGRIETHFHVFGSLAFLAVYRDWRVFIPATAVVAIDHLLRGLYWPQTVYGVLSASVWRTIEHAGWVIFEDIFLIRSVLQSVSEMRSIALQRAQLEASHQLVEDEVMKRTAELSASEAKIRAILDHAPDGIITATGEAMLIQNVNPAGAELFGYQPNELVGFPLATIVTERAPKNDQVTQPQLASIGTSASLRRKGVEVLGRHRSGREFPAELRLGAAPLRGEIVFTAIVRDTSERRRSEELERERNSLRDAVTSLDKVLGVVGHELRTPLAAIRAMSEFLASDHEGHAAEYDKYLLSINEQAVHMAEMVNDLLEVARHNSGTARWNWEPLALEDACASGLDAIRSLIDPAKLSLGLTVEPPGLSMNGDPAAIRRLIVNLVNNAFKHTQQGYIRVTAQSELEESDAWVRIEVADTGRGMKAEITARLGQAFALNAGVVGENHVNGTGLGLAISKGIVAAHGGTMAVQSAEGRGTTVSVRLRADLAEPVKNIRDANILTSVIS